MTRRSAQPTNRFPAWIGIAGAGAIVLFLLWLLGQADWLPTPLRGMIPPATFNNRIFVASADIDHNQAKSLYRQALSDLESGNYENALATFKQLETVYPGLQDMLWLHEAECYAGQGNEWAVQKKLSSLLEQHPDSALKILALYRIGQSQYRGSEWDKAKATFEQIRSTHPASTYALGSLYYLGALQAKQTDTKPKAIEALQNYLSQCPDCKFSGDAADLLEKLLPVPTAQQHGLIGIADAAASKELKKTLLHLNKGPVSMTWLALGKSQIQAGQTQVGVKTLIAHIGDAKDMDTVRTAVDLILAHTPGSEHATILKALADKRVSAGGDYILWKLASANEEQSKTYYQMLVQHYPEGDYAPESAWRLLWPLILEGNFNGYVGQAQNYLVKYPYAKSAPKALFWIAKLLERTNPAEATRAYERILQQYPTTYYAFRAKGRLNTLAGGKSDPGWPTLTARTDYPPQETSFDTLNILPDASQFGSGALGWTLHNQAKELQSIGATEDTTLLVSESLGKLPPAVESWAAQVSGDRAKGLRIIRDALDEQQKNSIQAGNKGDSANGNTGTKDEMKLLYPVYFAPNISQAGSKNRLDPYLIQSLMREESYFNEFAISGSNARGLMQLLPSTARDVAGWENMPGFQTGDLFRPEVNVRLGSRYLAHLHELFNGNSMPAVGAYNGGPGAMKRWVQGSRYFANDPDMFVELIPYEQSRDYIKKVFASYWNYTRIYSHPTI